jgi:hypothetical protein
VDTLHMKNLLHLGEGRCLTTLLLKQFPLFKTQFVRDAHAFVWHRTIRRFYYPSVDVGLTLRFTTWAILRSWSSFMVSAVSRCISWSTCYSCLRKFLYYTPSTYCYLFSIPCRLYIYCISSSDKANLSLCYHLTAYDCVARCQASARLLF